jgi:hypothetical protein
MAPRTTGNVVTPRRPASTPRSQANTRVAAAAGAGYSGTPLARKLGIRPGQTIAAIGAPGNYRDLVAPLPEGVTFVSRAATRVDITHLFATRLALLDRKLRALRRGMRDDATLWVSWPKKASCVVTDITEDAIRAVALPLGLVDVKVCAVDDVWSALKLVIRRELRQR